MNIDNLTYFSYLSIKRNLILPLKKFMSFNEKINCARSMSYEKNFSQFLSYREMLLI